MKTLIYFVVIVSHTQQEEKEMSLIENYKKNAGGSWLKADTVQDGMIVKISEIWLDSETFDKSYICIKGQIQTGDEVQVRLGIQNVNRVSDILGDDDKTWPGNYLECIGTQSYPGMSAKGILWRGKKNETTPAPAQQPF